jgi:predicted AlkP superfamily phosphohydrolase/phosphomutase
MERGSWGPLKTIHPPITVPAWACMMSGYDPGQLGIYGFRNRKDHSYDGYAIANSASIKVDRVWDILSRAGKRVILVGVPQTYPVRPINGYIVTDFLTPSTQSAYTCPPELKAEVEQVSGGYVFDVENFRTDNKAALLQRIYEKTRKHFAVAKHLLRTKPWDFFMMVEMGVDRIHHGFWSYMDSTHRKYEPGNPFENAIRDYYHYIDKKVGEVLELLPDDTAVLVVSDHGAKKLEGGICFNEWLIQEGYLVLKSYPHKLTPIDKVEIDWSKTKAWGDGGYYGRLFLNVKGREAEGIIEAGDYEKVRTELIEKIETIENPEGKNIGSRAHRPEQLYRELKGVPPDLMVYFGDLHWRSVGTVGYRSIYTFDNDTGPDEANHDWNGIYISSDSFSSGKGNQESFSLLDTAAGILLKFGLSVSNGTGLS